MAKFVLNVSRKTIISLIPPFKENKKGKGKLRLYSIVGKVLSDERLGAKLRVTENRCVLFDSFTYIYPALLPQHWALYAKVDSTPHLYIYLFIYLLHTYRDKRTKMHQDKNSLFVLEKPADWPRFFSLSSPVNKTVSLAHRSSWLTNSTFIRA